MKNKILILTLIGTISTLMPVNAELTTSDTHSREYLENHGYSEAFIRAAEKSSARVNSTEYKEPEQKKLYEKTPIKQIRYFFMNVDPSYDDDSFMKHDIHTSPNWRDL